MKSIYIYTAVFLLGFVNTGVQARQPVADSLVQWLDSYEQMDTTRAINLAQIGWALYRGYPDSSLIYSRESLRLSESLDFKRGEALANRYIGSAHFVMRNTDSALVYFQRSLVVFEEMNDEQGISSMRASMGSIYAVNDQFDLAIQSFLEAIPAFEAQGNRSGIAVMYNNIGNLYLEQELFENAFFNYEKALTYLDDPQNPQHVLIYNNMSNVLFELNRFEEALETAEKAVEFALEIERYVNLPNLYRTIGRVEMGYGNDEKALDSFLKALEYSRYIRNVEDIIQINSYTAILYERRGDYEKARGYLFEVLKAFENPIRGLDTSKRDALHLMAKVEAELDNHEYSSRYALAAMELADSLYTEEMAFRISELETIYETEKKAAQIEMLEIQNEVANLRSVLIGGFGLFVILSGSFWFRSYYRKKSEEKRKRLESMQRELKQYGFVLAEKNKFIASFKEDLEEVRRHVRTMEGRKELTHLVDTIHANTNLNDDEEILFNRIEQTNTGFFTELRSLNGDLTSKDERLATLVHMDLSNKDISNILHIEPESVKQAKRRLKKKLNLDSGTDLNHFLKHLAA